MKIRKSSFGYVPAGGPADLYTVENRHGMVLKVTNFGGIIQSILVPDRKGQPADVVLGFDTLEGYLGEHPYIGTLVGRYANRIRHARFELDGEEYQLAKNHGKHHLHGGLKAFDKVLWEASEYADEHCGGVALTHVSPHMDEGYPGSLKVSVSISLDEDNRVSLDYQAGTDRSTHLNLTHHGYFNLNGGKGNILDHELRIFSDRYVVTDDELIPTGEIRSLNGDALDFREMKPIGRDIGKVPGGYDHCYVLAVEDRQAIRAASVYHPASGRRMEVITTEPGLQFYSANFLEGIHGKAGTKYGKHQALCLETQHFPDSPNQPHFPATLLQSGEQYRQHTVYSFAWD